MCSAYCSMACIVTRLGHAGATVTVVIKENNYVRDKHDFSPIYKLVYACLHLFCQYSFSV